MKQHTVAKPVQERGLSMTLVMAFLMVPGYDPWPSNTPPGRWLWFGICAFCMLQAVLIGEVLGD